MKHKKHVFIAAACIAAVASISLYQIRANDYIHTGTPTQAATCIKQHAHTAAAPAATRVDTNDTKAEPFTFAASSASHNERCTQHVNCDGNHEAHEQRHQQGHHGRHH